MIKAEQRSNSDRYILITQCLQNDFLKNKDCRLCIDNEESRRLLYGENSDETSKVENGPLYCFLKNTVGEIKNRGNLYVIHIRDHHESKNDNYQHEMMKYGRHCEIGTEGWEFLNDEFKPFFKLDNSDKNGDEFEASPKDRIFEVKSTSIYDFKPEKPGDEARLEKILNYLIVENPEPANVYVLVIGVYTDIKVKLLLTDLRTRYPLNNINVAVASSLTASRSIERHIGALDFMKKVLDVEILHKIPDLLTFLGEKSSKVLSRCKNCNEGDDFYKEYGEYELDKQKILDYERRKRIQFTQNVEKKAEKLYKSVYRINRVLALIGVLFLLAPIVKLIFTISGTISHEPTNDIIFGGIGLGAFMIIFFSKRMSILQKNLTNFAQFTMILDSHSLKTAIARHHLTRPIQLKNVTGMKDIENQEKAVSLLKQNLDAIGIIDKRTNQLLYSLLYTDENLKDIAKALNLTRPHEGEQKK